MRNMIGRLARRVPAVRMSVWRGVPQGARDAILGLNEAYAGDASGDKVNLGVGAYRDDAGRPVVLACVRRAEEEIVKAAPGHEYAGIDGVRAFVDAAVDLAYGDAVPRERVAAAQSLSGTGALRLGAAFAARFLGGARVYVPRPTWGNHAAVFRDAGVSVHEYAYYDRAQRGVDAAAMVRDIESAPPGSLILLHACAHNPTGADPSDAEWELVCDAVQKHKHVPFFDMAYQGFASGDPGRDAAAVRRFGQKGLPVILAQSFAKNMGLYGERVGALSLVCADGDEAGRVLSQVKILARAMYSNPPVHGARIAARVLGDADLRSLWLEEVAGMAKRMAEMRARLRSELEAHCPAHDWAHVTAQIGMFCYTGLSAGQAAALTGRHRVYLTADGRVSVCGLTTGNVARVAAAIADVVSTVPAEDE